jgi:hypothetical protein
MYGEMVVPETWKPEDEHIMEMRDILTTLEGEANHQSAHPAGSRKAFTGDEQDGKAEQREKCSQLCDELQSIAKLHCSKTLKKLQTIPGISPQDEHNADCGDQQLPTLRKRQKAQRLCGLVSSGVPVRN